jgi:preprotein translocase subunit SecB
MQVIKSSLSFDGYAVDEISFKINHSFNANNGKEICLNPVLSKEVLENRKNQSKYIVKLSFEISHKTTSDSPFELKVALSGHFTLGGEEKNKALIQENAVAILFPYLRSIISIVTLNANISPLLLPAMNVAEMLKNSEKTDSQDNQ